MSGDGPARLVRLFVHQRPTDGAVCRRQAIRLVRGGDGGGGGGVPVCPSVSVGRTRTICNAEESRPNYAPTTR